MATRTICPHFLRGRCRFGDRCKFEHNYPSAYGGPAEQRREVCSYFMNGRCKFGDRCKFEHPSPAPVQNGLYSGFERTQRHQGDPQPWRRQSQPPNNSYNAFNSYNRRSMDAFGPGKQHGMFGDRGSDIQFQTPLSSQSGNESYGHDNRSAGHTKRQVRFNESGPQIRLYSKQGNGYEDFFQDSDRDLFSRGPQFQSNFGRNYSGAGRNVDTGFGPKPSPYTQTHSPEEIRVIIQEDMRSWQRQGIWPLSSYSYVWKTPSLPGLKDYSPEELRWEAYQAQKQGSVERYKHQVAALLVEAQKWKEKYATISLPDTRQLLTILQFGSKESPDDQSGPVFQSPPPAGRQLSPVDLFSPPGATASAAPLQQPIAQSTPGIASLQKREASGADVDGGPTSSLTNEDLSKKYGISAEDILAFKAQEFVLGKIPICPPPPELC